LGSFFTNIQVHVGEIPPDEARRTVIRAIQDHAARSGLETVPGEPAERSVPIGPASHAPWISVFDEAGDDQDGDRLRELAEALSAPASVALGILVHDSDILELRLCRAGARSTCTTADRTISGKCLQLDAASSPGGPRTGATFSLAAPALEIFGLPGIGPVCQPKNSSWTGQDIISGILYGRATGLRVMQAGGALRAARACDLSARAPGLPLIRRRLLDDEGKRGLWLTCGVREPYASCDARVLGPVPTSKS
jgi:hypothetical protein